MGCRRIARTTTNVEKLVARSINCLSILVGIVLITSVECLSAGCASGRNEKLLENSPRPLCLSRSCTELTSNVNQVVNAGCFDLQRGRSPCLHRLLRMTIEWDTPLLSPTGYTTCRAILVEPCRYFRSVESY